MLVPQLPVSRNPVPLLAHILLLDTCAMEGGVALAQVRAGRATVVGEVAIHGKTFAAELVPAISGLLRDAGIGVANLAAVAVVHGPGSFTGVRIGVSTAKGLVEAGRIPLIAISRLAVLARMSGAAWRTIAVLDAGRGEFYVGIYDKGGREKGGREALMSFEEVVYAAAGNVSTARQPSSPEQSQHPQATTIVVCEERVERSLAALGPHMIPPPTPADALPMAVERWQSSAFDDALTLDGNYLRRSESEIFARQASDIEARRKGAHDLAP